MSIVNELIQRYGLEPHPEGGWFKQTYKSNEQIAAVALPKRFIASRVFSTAIYFLLEKGNFSAFHRIKSDECWHFYAGDPLLIYVIEQNGELKVISLSKVSIVLLVVQSLPVLNLKILNWPMEQNYQ
jgi:predicted cupin superfamily sugar epimerase